MFRLTSLIYGGKYKKNKLSKFTYDNLRGSVVVQLTKITFL